MNGNSNTPKALLSNKTLEVFSLRRSIVAMKAKVMGFEWQLGTGISLGNLFHRLTSLRDQKILFGDHERLVYVCDREGYHAGLFLTIKDQRKFAEVQKSGGKYEISVRDIEQGKNVVDFNFFAIHQLTRRGVYLHYHQSCSLGQFTGFCKDQYDTLKDELIQHAITDEGASSEGQRDKIKRRFKGSLKYETMVRQESIQALLQELGKIRSFEFDFLNVVAHQPVFTPYDGTARRVSHKVSFKKNGRLGAIRQAILGSISAGGLENGRVEGRDLQGVERIIKLTDNPDYFAEYEHDIVAGNMEFDLDKLSEAWAVNRIVEIAKNRKGLFETPIV